MGAPDRIYIDRGPKGGWMHRDKRMPDTVAEYIRLDPNTRIVTVDQLERWSALIRQLDIQDDYGWNIGDNSVAEIRAIIEKVK